MSTERRTASDDIEISVVAVIWNNLELIPGLIDSIRSQMSVDRAEIILVDNGSTDGSLEYLRTRSDVILIENGVNAGYPVGMNRGVRVARGEKIVLSNPDIFYREGSLAAMAAMIDEDRDVGGVSPVIEVPIGRVTGSPDQPSQIYPLLATDPGLYYGWNFFSGFMSRFAGNRLINWNVEFHPERNHRELAWIHGCCGMYRRDVLDQVGGGFDERFFLYFEDADLGRSIRKNGWRLRMAHAARVFHFEDQSCKQVATRSRQFFVESWHRYHRKHSSLLFRCVAYWVVLAAVLMQVCVQLVHKARRRESLLPQMASYLRAHCSAPFRDLEQERRGELEQIEQSWNPYSSELQNRFANFRSRLDRTNEEQLRSTG